MAAHLSDTLAAVTICLAFFCWKASGQLPPDDFTLEMLSANPDIQARDHTTSFTCRLGIGVRYRFKYQIHWVYVSGLPWQSSAEKVLAQNEDLTDTSAKYSVSHQQIVSFNDPTTTVLTVTNVTDADEGRYLCRVVQLQDGMTKKEVQAILVVQHDAERVELQIDQGETITAPDNVTLPEGSHSVRCSALGFNPSSDYSVSVYFNNGELGGADDSRVQLALMEEKSKAAGAPRYRLERTIQVELTEDHSGQTLRCVARNTRLNTQLEATATITVTYDDTDDDEDGGVSGSPVTDDVRGSSTGQGHTSGKVNGNGATGDHRPRLAVLLATLVLLFCTLQ